MRPYCYLCRKPAITCYCAELRPVTSRPRVVILMHPLEARHPVGTGRMVHRCLSNSRLWVGTEFNQESELDQLIRDPNTQPLLLYPGSRSISIDSLTHEDREALLPSTKDPVVIVLDATWDLAQKMLHRSPTLQSIPRISFQSRDPSRFRIRRQPKPECLSSLEAIHRVLTLLDPGGTYDAMLGVFDRMVERQIEYARQSNS